MTFFVGARGDLPLQLFCGSLEMFETFHKFKYIKKLNSKSIAL